MDDETISTFTALTGATTAQATQYLNLADGNLEQAAQLWFETGGSLAQESTSSTNAPPVPASTRPSQSRPQGYQEDDDGNIIIDSDDDEVSGQGRPNTEDDEAMARRLQEEMYGSSGQAQQDVRAPISRTTETLVGPGSGGYGGGYGGDDEDIEAMIAQQMAARQARQAARSRPGIFNQRDTQAGMWEDSEARAESLARATGGASAQSARAQSLAEMFRPPFEIISRLSWDEARTSGREEKKWLLVNVQDASVFDCQVLNRDLWKDERVVAVIRESFIFLQYSRHDPRSEGYMQYYFNQAMESADAYPHIAIIDPRTGEQMKVWSGRPTPKVDDFVEALYNFLDRYSLDTAKRNPVAKRKAEQPKAFDVNRMTEEEMLEMALQQSLANGGAGTPPKLEDPDDLTKSVDFGQKAGSSGTSEQTSMEGESSVAEDTDGDARFNAIPSNRPHEEPPADPSSTTRIQFRHPGGRVVRRFSLDDPVSRIYEWLKAAPPAEDKAGKEFALMFMGKNLIEELSSTIDQAKLRNASINIEWTED